MTNTQAPPGWYPQAQDGIERYWYGYQWTDHVRLTQLDTPLPPPPPPAAGAGAGAHRGSQLEFHRRQHTWPAWGRIAWWTVALPAAIGSWAVTLRSTGAKIGGLSLAGIVGLSYLGAAASPPPETEQVATGASVNALADLDTATSNDSTTSLLPSLVAAQPSTATPTSTTATTTASAVSAVPGTQASLAAPSTTEPPTTTAQPSATTEPPPSTTLTTATTAAPSCHPAYRQPCLPIVNDLNCDDITGEVFLVDPATDPYRLDRDADGRACAGD